MSLKPLSLTYVVYDHEDSFQKALAILTFSPYLLFTFLISVFIARRESSILLFMVAQLLNEALNQLLKDLIKEPRPPSYL
jgi:dolichyldiphosphatase